MTTDAELQQAVLDALRDDPRVEASAIGVAVEHGVVTLSGTIESYWQKLAAVETAHRVAGVLDVANEIEVRDPHTPGQTDTQLARAVRCALTEACAGRIQATVSHGWVRLQGTVEHAPERDAAGAAVRPLAGLRGLINEIVVVPRPRADGSNGSQAATAAAPPHAADGTG